MVTVNIYEFKARLAKFTRLVKSGERVILCERNKPFAELRRLENPPAERPKRQLGALRGQGTVGAAFWECEGEIESVFLGNPAETSEQSDGK